MEDLLYVIPANSTKEDVLKSLKAHPEIKFVSLVGVDIEALGTGLDGALADGAAGASCVAACPPHPTATTTSSAPTSEALIPDIGVAEYHAPPEHTDSPIGQPC